MRSESPTRGSCRDVTRIGRMRAAAAIALIGSSLTVPSGRSGRQRAMRLTAFPRGRQRPGAGAVSRAQGDGLSGSGRHRRQFRLPPISPEHRQLPGDPDDSTQLGHSSGAWRAVRGMTPRRGARAGPSLSLPSECLSPSPHQRRRPGPAVHPPLLHGEAAPGRRRTPSRWTATRLRGREDLHHEDDQFGRVGPAVRRRLGVPGVSTAVKGTRVRVSLPSPAARSTSSPCPTDPHVARGQCGDEGGRRGTGLGTASRRSHLYVRIPDGPTVDPATTTTATGRAGHGATPPRSPENYRFRWRCPGGGPERSGHEVGEDELSGFNPACWEEPSPRPSPTPTRRRSDYPQRNPPALFEWTGFRRRRSTNSSWKHDVNFLPPR